MTVNAIQIHQTGGIDVLRWEKIEIGEPAAHQIRIRHTAIGLNYIDVYFRMGLYKPAAYPFIPGMEAAGVVEAVGAAVTDLHVGDRVAYGATLGAYTEARVIDAERVVKIPDGISDQTAAAMMLKGMTAQYLLRQTYPVKAGDTILFHAIAGGVGLIACQWAKKLGVTVIGTVGSAEKAELAKAYGCDYPIIYTKENFVTRVKELTNGKGVPVVYDSVGQDTFMQSLDCLQPMGTIVSFGQSSGSVPPLDIGILSAKGSLFLTRPTLMSYTASRQQLLTCTDDLFAVVQSGDVKIDVNQIFSLKDAGKAHAALETRQTTGSTVLLP
ncbi:quinone oxidoreductase family protein [Beggiatoa leptomitoformis]|uniref:NADPH:quinone reductase n=1 Tax=Beggiatoa leptomitoformis TaxID=288004 RepID=A0A2N9YE39_9GAMM|nr:quinone oxidoreductase [Beggiatoa leptomitoformis]ALG68873.1 NADPH:quinone reductase [Beggiatoa leptomitoformis]AUI68757.1 NADPH:quinone reductase [Beggiatoa leptomitoformis]